MRRKRSYRKIKIVLGVLLLTFFCAFLINRAERSNVDEAPTAITPSSHVTPNPHVTSLLSDYENNIRNLQRKTKTPGVAIVIVRDTSVVYIKGIGVREVGKPDSIDAHTVFRLASVSKCLAPVLTGLLVEDGLLSWDDPIIKYVPDFSLKSKANTDSLT